MADHSRRTTTTAAWGTLGRDRRRAGELPGNLEVHMLALNLVGTKEIIAYVIIAVIIIVAVVYMTARSRPRV
jgi:hypothetical protein